MVHKADIAARYNNHEYMKNNPTWHAEDSPWKARQIEKILLRNNLEPEFICEVGCGAGEILLSLKEKLATEKLHGYELSEDAFSICNSKKQKGLDFFLKDIQSTDEYYDVLLCIDVFEHVENYIEFIRNLKSKSKYQIFHIPLDISILSILRNMMMKARSSLGHLHYFLPETALATLQDAGLEIVDYFFTAPFEKNGIPPKTMREKTLVIPRRVTFKLSPSLLSKTLGGCSLMVLTS